MSADHGPVSDIEAEAQRQKTALLYRNSGIVLGVSVVNASVLAYVNSTLHASAEVAFLWWSSFVIITAGRYLLTLRFQAANPDAAAAPVWRRRHIVGTAIAAAAWSVGTVVFAWHAPDGARLFTGLVMAGMVAGAVPTLAPVPVAFRTFTYPVLVCLAAVILLQADSVLVWAFGSMIVIFLAGILLSTRYLQETLDVSIRLGLTQGRLVAQLEQARDAGEAALAERKRAEVTLQASEERSRIILQYSPTGILHYNNELVVTYCNDSIAQILQVRSQELLGFDMKTLEDQRVVPALRAATEGKEGTYEGEF